MRDIMKKEQNDRVELQSLEAVAVVLHHTFDPF